ncbi:SUKH-3 domain-containing protein [Micromonospora sp. DT178]|uniref:SUKH-3 domain-containing protein n=1 Tax=Micromonospora sp. DT178 TaxID=3393436 RepID=UPI003CF79DAB
MSSRRGPGEQVWINSIFAVDERGRVFALDQAGEWFLGEDIDAALTPCCSAGRRPAYATTAPGERAAADRCHSGGPGRYQ